MLVGAGPGDPELLTLKAARAIGAADWLLVDDLVADGVLAHAQPGARTVRVGKRGGCRSTPQAFIERLMIRLARRGLIVARVKGGDPFVFGRGGEELAALGAAGIAVEVVPGVTAGIAAPAALGIPITHRGLARGAIFVTGHAAGVDEPRVEEPRPEERVQTMGAACGLRADARHLHGAHADGGDRFPAASGRSLSRDARRPDPDRYRWPGAR